MKVLIADDDRGQREFLQRMVARGNTQVAWEAVDAEVSPKDVIARELRRILDGCPICDGCFRNHSYALLTWVVLDEQAKAQQRLQQFLGSLGEHRWREVLRSREWDASKDTAHIFAVRCDLGRIGILTVLSPAGAESPDVPLGFTILTLEEGYKLQALIAPGSWMPLRFSGPRHFPVS